MTDAPTIRFRCTLCGWCCRNYTPLITAADARRIQKALRKPLSEFLAFYRPEDFPVAPGADANFFQTKHGPVVMALQRTSGGCVFLQEDMCSIQAFKPGLCGAFPFQPVSPGDLDGPFDLLGDPCDGNNDTDEVVSQDEARTSYEVFVRDYYQYQDLVRSWNDDASCTEHEIEDFLNHVGLDWWSFEL